MEGLFMRAFRGQMSDNQPIRRSLPEKQKQLRDLKETLAAMKSHTSPALKESVRKRIAQLEAELTAAPVLKSNRPSGAARPRQERGNASRRPTIRSL
jgi:ribosomal protein L29